MRFTKKIIYMFDGDAAGQKAARRAVQFIEKDDIDLRCVILPDGQDPDDYVRANGGAALRGLLDESVPLMDFVFGKLEEESDISTPGGRAKAMRSALELIYPLRASYMIDGYYMQIADRLGLDIDTIRSSAGKVFRDVQQREEAMRRREQQRERAQGSPETPRAIPQTGRPPHDEVPYEEVPYDYEPLEGAAPTGDAVGRQTPEPDAPTGLLTDLERRQLACEHELLTLLTTYPDSFRSYAERITEVEWVDARSEAIAWSVLATPEGTAPADAMAAARAVCPEAAQLVGSGLLSATSRHPTETNIEFLLDTLELYTTRRRMKSAQARLRSDRSMESGERRELAVQATRDAARIRDLERAVEGIADPFGE